MAGDGYSVPATDVQNGCNLGASAKFTKPFKFSFEVYEDMINASEF